MIEPPEVGVDVVLPLEVRRVQLGGGDLAARQQVVRRPAPSAGACRSRRGNSERAVFGVGRVRERLLEREARLGDVLAEHVHDVERV